LGPPFGDHFRPKIDQVWPEGVRERQRWAPGPFPAVAPILAAFWDRPWEGPCAPNTALAISKPHFGICQKVTLWLPFDLRFGAFGHPWGSCWALWEPKVGHKGQKWRSKSRPKKRSEKSHASVRRGLKAGTCCALKIVQSDSQGIPKHPMTTPLVPCRHGGGLEAPWSPIGPLRYPWPPMGPLGVP
jgi:hypothetical protein